jgi:peroxiredoxin
MNRGIPFLVTVAIIIVLGAGAIATILLMRSGTESSAPAVTPNPTAETNPSTATGSRVGQKAVNFTLSDQNGEEVSLHDFAGKVILLDLSAAWCGPCRAEAKDAGPLYKNLKEKGLIVLTVLVENADGNPPTIADLREWAGVFELEFPVLGDPQGKAWGLYNEDDSVPLNMIIDRDLTIRYKQAGYNRIQVEDVLKRILAEGETT